MTERDTMMRGFAAILPDHALTTLDRLVPTRPWREALPERFWHEPEVVEHLEDPGRYHLYARLTEVLGRDAADAALAYLPPVPWAVLERARLADALR